MKNWKEKLKPHLLPISLLTFGGLLLTSVWKSPGNLYFILAVIGGIMIIAGLFNWAHILERKKTEENPYYKDDLVYDTPWEKRMHTLSILLAFTGFFGLAATTLWTENLLNELFFFIVSGTAGAILATTLFLFIKKRKPEWYVDNETRSKEIISFWLGIAMWTVIVTIGITFALPPVNQRMDKLQILRHGANEDNDKAYIWVNLNGRETRLRPNNSDWHALKDRDSTMVVISKGLLGFEYTCEMLPVQTGNTGRRVE